MHGRYTSHGRDFTTQTLCLLHWKLRIVSSSCVSEQDVSIVVRCLPSGLKIVPGTMTFHQIVTNMSRRISCRKLSCFCCDATDEGKSCECYIPVTVTFPEPTSSLEQVVSQPAERGTMSGDMLTQDTCYVNITSINLRRNNVEV